MGECPFCGKEVLNVKNRNGTLKRFCDNKCRWNFANKKKVDVFMAEVGEAIMAVMKKHKYLR